MGNESASGGPPYFRIAIWVGAAIFVLWVIYGVYAYRSTNEFNAFGDAFGALNTLFSGLAFAALVVALLMQRQELANQLEELRESRKALHASAEANARMAEAAVLQIENAGRPRLVFYLLKEHKSGRWYLQLRNSGNSVASEIQLTLEVVDPLNAPELRDLTLPLLRVPELCGVEFNLAPGQALRWEIEQLFMGDVLRAEAPLLQWKITARYVLSNTGKRVEEASIITLSVYQHALPGI